MSTKTSLLFSIVLLLSINSMSYATDLCSWDDGAAIHKFGAQLRTGAQYCSGNGQYLVRPNTE